MLFAIICDHVMDLFDNTNHCFTKARIDTRPYKITVCRNCKIGFYKSRYKLFKDYLESIIRRCQHTHAPYLNTRNWSHFSQIHRRHFSQTGEEPTTHLGKCLDQTKGLFFRLQFPIDDCFIYEDSGHYKVVYGLVFQPEPGQCQLHTVLSGGVPSNWDGHTVTVGIFS